LIDIVYLLLEWFRQTNSIGVCVSVNPFFVKVSGS
jgi:hypothetical protein